MANSVLRASFVFVACMAVGAVASAGNVRIAERPQVGPFKTLQAAVDAALEGESLLVAPDNYASFTIDGKSVRLFVTGTGEAVIAAGRVSVKNLAAGQSVVLTRLRVTGTVIANVAAPALEISNVSGHVRVYDSTLKGIVGGQTQLFASAGARLTSSQNVLFSGCTIDGADGFNQPGEEPVDGGNGVTAIQSSAAFYDCTVRGGEGSEETSPNGGNGGHGVSVTSFGVVAVGCTIQGNYGGGGDYIGCNAGGLGGDGVRLDGAQVHVLASAITAGGGGWSSCGPASPGGQTISTYNGSFIDLLNGARRKLSAPRITADDTDVPITITGQNGDAVFLLSATRPSFLFQKSVNGVWMVPLPTWLTSLQQGTIGGSGTLVLNRKLPITNSPAPAGVYSLQALCRDTAGKLYLTGLAQVLSIDAAGGPDCNGNARHDFVDVLFGGAADCNKNLTPDTCDPDCNGSGVPDECEIASGVLADCNGNGVPDGCDLAAGTPDCNGNGVPDSCDIAAHASPDVNQNGVPDECEAQYTTRYVDPSAAPGGNGSQGSPFQTLAQGVQASFFGDTLELADGTYAGPANRDLDLGGRSITLRGAHGSSACIVDCEYGGRALRAANYETVVVEGITFQHGTGFSAAGGFFSLSGANVTARECVFVGATAGYGGGGAIDIKQGSLRLEGCTFIGNIAQHSSSGWGGAVHIERATFSARDCLFANCSATSGGAIFVLQGTVQPITITHSTFLANTASAIGGAISEIGGASFPGAATRIIDDCLFAGNSAGQNGGAIVCYSPIWIRDTTIAGNSAGGKGGGIALFHSASASLANSILWDNTAPTGAQICLGDGASPQANLAVSYCDVAGGQAGVLIQFGNLNWSTGNLNLDPQFADADGPDNDPFTVLDNDYALGPVSPCIDAGDNAAIVQDVLDIDGDGDMVEPTPLDLRHLPRRADIPGVPNTGSGVSPLVDLGAFERQP